MKATIYVPYANGDCVKGFKADKEMTLAEYEKKILQEYTSHREGVSYMMEHRLGMNIAFNNFAKERVNVKKQTYKYSECPCTILDIDGYLETLSHLDEMHRTKKKFIIQVIFNESSMLLNDSLCEDVRSWIQDTAKVNACQELTDEQALFHLPTKDLKIMIDEDKSNAVLNKCKLIEVINNKMNKLALLVDSITFVKG